MIFRILAVSVFPLFMLTAQPQPGDDPLKALQIFIGKWSGEAVGKAGKGTTKREYSFELRGRFIVARNHAVYPIQEGKPKAEVHEDLGIFSYDRAARKLVLRQFHVEGFVNEYRSTVADAAAKKFEFVTERIENIAPGWRAREVYSFSGPDEFTETFLLAGPGKDFEVYSEARLRRER